MKEERKRRISIKDMVLTGMFAAMIALLAQLAIPTPWQVAFTLQTFAVALAGFCLGRFQGVLSVVVYIMLGIIGIPVFTGFAAGLSALVRPEGGYIWGFLFLSFACGMGVAGGKRCQAVLSGCAGLLICYVCGATQFVLLMERTVAEALLLTVVPYIAKDVISVVAAYGLSIRIRRIMNREKAPFKASSE